MCVCIYIFFFFVSFFAYDICQGSAIYFVRILEKGNICLLRPHGHISVNFRECYIYLPLYQNVLSPNHAHSIFLRNGLFVHRLHQIGSRINCWRWNFLILAFVTANEDGWDKAEATLCRGGALIPHCVG